MPLVYNEWLTPSLHSKPLAMVDLALSVACTRHSPEQKIAQGSETVFVHNKAVARKGDKTECSATIAEGSPNVFIGSGQATYLEMKSEFTGAQQALFFAVEFLVPPTALLIKGIGKAITQAGKSIAMRGAYVGAAVVGRAKHIYRKSVFRFRQKFAKTAEEAADNALRMGKTSGAAAELHVNGRIYIGVSGMIKDTKALHPTLREILDEIPKRNKTPWRGRCTEIQCIDKALKAGHNLHGALGKAVNIGTSGSGHLTPKKPCLTCQYVSEKLGVTLK
ncbi:PAAR domain-containing protein [Pasteurella sp. PK-2025]|uniref:PAAR domain-containing protein n=1 Tax=Pasteurella sp. PK-2025 TaxID=3413133 RepID=UPI003C743137